MHIVLLVGGSCEMVAFLYWVCDFHALSISRQALVATGLAASVINMYSLIFNSPRAGWISVFVAVIAVYIGLPMFFRDRTKRPAK